MLEEKFQEVVPNSIILEGTIQTAVVLKTPVKTSDLTQEAKNPHWVSLLVEVEFIDEQVIPHRNVKGERVNTCLVAFKCLMDCHELTVPKVKGYRKQYVISASLISNGQGLVNMQNDNANRVCIEMTGKHLDVCNMIRPFRRKQKQFVFNSQFIWLPECDFTFHSIEVESKPTKPSNLQVAEPILDETIPVYVLDKSGTSSWHLV